MRRSRRRKEKEGGMRNRRGNERKENEEQEGNEEQGEKEGMSGKKEEED